MAEADFATFVLKQLPAPPSRLLEIGCGRQGGLVELLAARGYDVLGVDPHAPQGDAFVQARFQDAAAELPRDWDAVIAGRVLHHVHPLDEGLAILAQLAPLLIADEFAWDLIDEPGQDWYEAQHRMLVAAGAEPYGPPDLDAWRARHTGLHPHDRLLAALRAQYDERVLEWVPYFHRWLGGPASEPLERSLIDARAIPAIGYRWAGTRR